MTSRTVIIIDDEPQIRTLLSIVLEAQGYIVRTAGDGATGLVEIAMSPPDIVLLDLSLPDMDGREVLGKMRQWSNIPVIILSVRGSDVEKAALLDAGADDYLTKPFSNTELLARMRTALRHQHPLTEVPQIYQHGDLSIDFSLRKVSVGSTDISLTATEFRLLRYFVENEGKVLTYNQILREVWSRGGQEQYQYVRVFVAQLRRKIQPSNSAAHYIATEIGVGYRWDPRVPD